MIIKKRSALSISAVWIFFVFLSSWAAATDANSAPSIFFFRMRDGSALSGTLQEQNIEVKSAHGTLTVPVTDIMSYREGELRLMDGSVVKGEIVDSSLSVISKYGRLTLVPKDIAWFLTGRTPEKVADR